MHRLAQLAHDLGDVIREADRADTAARLTTANLLDHPSWSGSAVGPYGPSGGKSERETENPRMSSVPSQKTGIEYI